MAKRVAKAAIDVETPEQPAPMPVISRLDQVIGQARAKDTLQSCMQSGRVHHAWIFHGPKGVGKCAAAVAFGATLIDPTTSVDLGGHMAPDPESQTQQLVRAGTHPDLRVISKELAAVSGDERTRSGKQITLPIEVIREFLLEPASKSRVMAGQSLSGRVFIVDEAELMDQRTQNVLLKTMEEPPAGCVIILVTSSEDRLLATIRSRSQRVAFTPLTDLEMQQWLHTSGREVSEESKAWVLRFAAGSPGAALLAIDHNLIAWHQGVSPLIEQAFKGSFPPELAPALAALVDERASESVKANPEASKDAANKAWARRVLSYVADDARSRLRQRASRVGVGADAVRTDASVARAVQAIDAVSIAEQQLNSNVNLGLVMENLVAQICRPVGETV